jgi:anthranilate 1,2-dioxygenase ferredoxin reductase subunit
MTQRFVIIGAGPAGMRAAEVLRAGAAEAEITLIGDESAPPYDRPPLSKAFLTDGLAPTKLALKPESFYAEQRITLRLGVAATRIERAEKRVVLADGADIAYDKLLIAAGCRARRLPSALDAAPVHYLRSLADAERIRAALRPEMSVVLIGGGFIGLEIAASARTLGAHVTVLEMAPRLLSRGTPSLVSDFAWRLHQGHGVAFELEARIERIAAAGARLAVTTQRGTHEADLVIAGVGAVPNTELAEAAGLECRDGIRVDEFGRTSDAAIFAAGDATRHLSPLLDREIRVESWQVALNQAAAVAKTMLGGTEPYAELPWLWTDQYDSNVQVLGLFDEWQELVVRGDPASSSFTLLGVSPEGRIAAAVTVNSGRDMAVLKRLAASRASLPVDRLADPAQKLSDLLKTTRAR